VEISIVIRTIGNERMPLLLDSLFKQTYIPSEVIIVNNGPALDSDYDVKEVRISDEEFTHMYSTNLGVSLANNELVCITNGHSLPLNNEWLENGVKRMEKDVAGVTGRPLPHNALARKVYSVAQKLFLGSSLCTICCIIKKSLWSRYPFDEKLPDIIPETKQLGGEDYDWGLQMKSLGYRIVYEPKFSVFHAHHDKLYLESERNLKVFLLHSERNRKINALNRPRKSFSKVMI
jgi:GT2 family glycosyltransferase